MTAKENLLKLAADVKAAHPEATEIIIRYSGSGDEGFVSDINSDATDWEPPHCVFEEPTYELLAEHRGGWDINEGSCGKFVIDLNAMKITLEHTNFVISEVEDDPEVL